MDVETYTFLTLCAVFLNIRVFQIQADSMKASKHYIANKI